MILNKQSNTQSVAFNHDSNALSVFTTEEEAIIITLLYSDIFSFPLNKQELWRYLISNKKYTKKTFEANLRSLQPYLVRENNYYALKGKERCIEKRLKNQNEVNTKYALARKVATVLSKIPTIQCIGISGGLAAKQALPDDDIDLFVIAKPNSLFVTRFWIIVFLQMLGMRRSRSQNRAANKICANLLIDELDMVWQTDARNVYTAREIAQVYPLFERDDTYKKFVHSNSWVGEYLPNAFTHERLVAEQSIHTRAFSYVIGQLISLKPLELLMRFIQKKFMQRHRTTEIVKNHRLAFHPRDYRAEVLRQLKLKMRHLGLLTKN